MAVMKERFVRNAVIDYLGRRLHYGTNLRTKTGSEHGVDIRVRHNRYGRWFLVETKGESKAKSARSQRETSFIYSLGQIITRMASGARDYYGIGLPEKSAQIAIRRIPWKVAKKLHLCIFSVNINGKVTKYDWKGMRNVQK